ncbi:MAG: tetratricopeptide repeat protein, partial [bacterium]|nr:tetratricopeptide repeat protein [bacterium]
MILRTLLILTLTAAPVFAGSLDQARALIDEGQFAEAKPLLEKALNEKANEGEALLLLTRTCNALADWKDGVKHGKRTVKLLPESSEAHYEYAVALRIKMSNVGSMKAMFAIGNYKDELKAAIELDPKNIDALTERVGFLANAPGIAGGDLDEAATEAAKLEQLDWRVGKVMQIGIKAGQEDIPAAIGIANEVLERYPDDTDARSSLGFVLQNDEQYQAADEQFTLLAENEDPAVAAAALYQRGKTRVLGEYELEEAIEFFDNFIEVIGDGIPELPDESAAHWRIGMAQEKLARTADARASYTRAVELNPDFK